MLAGGLLYVFDPGGTLNVLNPISGRTVGSLPAASGHWNSPIVVGGRIILPVGDANDHATNGQLFIYHLPGLVAQSWFATSADARSPERTAPSM